MEAFNILDRIQHRLYPLKLSPDPLTWTVFPAENCVFFLPEPLTHLTNSPSSFVSLAGSTLFIYVLLLHSVTILHEIFVQDNKALKKVRVETATFNTDFGVPEAWPIEFGPLNSNRERIQAAALFWLPPSGKKAACNIPWEQCHYMH